MRYVDYGNEEVTDASKMVMLSETLSSVRLQAMKLNMIGLKPTSTTQSNTEEHKRVGCEHHLD